MIANNPKIFVTGHTGMVGSAVVRCLEKSGHSNIITCPKKQLDITDWVAINLFLEKEKPDIIINAAAKVGGIHANSTYPAEFIYENLALSINLTHAAYKQGIKRMLFLGSSCIYPRLAPQPIQEESLLTSPLEPTNEAYAIAKIAGLKLCQYYRKQYGVLYHSVMPTNLYGPNDRYDLKNAHVLPALIRKFHEAKEKKSPTVTLWGDGSARREFLHVDDLALAIVGLIGQENPPDWVNVGYGSDISIYELACMIQSITGYEGKIVFDNNQPNGTPQKLLDISKISAYGWSPKIPLREGLISTYHSFLDSLDSGRLRL